MPELPEVETIIRNFRPVAEGRRIVAFECRWPRQLDRPLVELQRALTGRRVERLSRRGKHIVWELDDGRALLVHLRMSGRFEHVEPGAPEPRFARSWWELDGGARIVFCDSRKFGRVRLVDDVETATNDLGPEPLATDFTPERLRDRLRGHRRMLKPLLLDQRVLAGLGNIYTDEALFRAGIHPSTRADRLGPRRVARLHTAIREVLEEGIAHNGTMIDWIYPEGRMQDFLRVYGRAGQPCPTCATPIRKVVLAQRGTHLCPRCQRR